MPFHHRLSQLGKVKMSTVAGPRKVPLNVWSRNAQISRFISAWNFAIFICFLAQSWATVHFYLHYGSGLKKLRYVNFFSSLLCGPPFWVFWNVYIPCSTSILVIYVHLISFIIYFLKPLRYVVGQCWKHAPLAYPFFGVEGTTSWVFKIWLYHFVVVEQWQ